MNYIIILLCVSALAGVSLLLFLLVRDARLSDRQSIVIGSAAALFILLSFFGSIYFIDGQPRQDIDAVELSPRKGIFEGHQYLLFRWSVIHDPNCDCRPSYLRTKAIRK